MRTINESCHLSVQRAFSERQVVLNPLDCRYLLPGTMEDIKISFLNDRATGSKRERDEVTSVTPESKRLCSGAFSCSTPRSASAHSWKSVCTTQAEIAKQGQVDTPGHLVDQNSEWDDSLLEPSDNEGDSPLYLTIDEIESLLVDDSADEPSGWDDENNTCVATLISLEPKDDGEKVSKSLCSKVDLSGNLTEEDSEHDEDQSNYAAVAPSPCNLVICHEELDHSSEQNGLFTCEGSHEDATSSEEKQDPALTISRTKQTTSIITDSTLSLQPLNPGQVSAAFFNAQAVVQHVSLSHNLPDSLKVYSPNELDILKEALSSTTSPAVTWEPHLSTGESGMGQEDMTPSKSPDIEETNNRQVGATTDPTDMSVNLSTTVRSSNQIQTSASVSCKKPNSSAPAKEKSLAAVHPIPRPASRHILCCFELEGNKDNYCRQVRMHIEGPESATNLQDPSYELASLLTRISKDNQNWQHPTNFTRRNYPRCGKRPSKRCSLNEWVIKNGGSKERFLDIPSPFERSPIPENLPFGSSG